MKNKRGEKHVKLWKVIAGVGMEHPKQILLMCLFAPFFLFVSVCNC